MVNGGQNSISLLGVVNNLPREIRVKVHRRHRVHDTKCFNDVWHAEFLYAFECVLQACRFIFFTQTASTKWIGGNFDLKHSTCSWHFFVVVSPPPRTPRAGGTGLQIQQCPSTRSWPRPAIESGHCRSFKDVTKQEIAKQTETWANWFQVDAYE